MNYAAQSAIHFIHYPNIFLFFPRPVDKNRSIQLEYTNTMAPANNPSIIGISGPSSSGKTTLARLLQTVFSGLDDQSNLLLLHEDDFYLPDNRSSSLSCLSRCTISLPTDRN